MPRRADGTSAVTVINMLTQPKGRVGYIISDTAITSPEGVLLRTMGKVMFGTARFPWALGITGNVAPEVLHRAIGEANPLTLKQLCKRLPSALRRAVTETAAMQRIPIAAVYCQVKGVAWDFAKNRPQGFTMQSDETQVLGAGTMEPFVWYDLPWMMGTHETAADLLGRPVDLIDPASFDADSDSMALVTAQRRRPAINVTPGAVPGFCRIGGEIHLTEVRKTGVYLYAVGQFPDPLGELIDPALNASEPM